MSESDTLLLALVEVFRQHRERIDRLKDEVVRNTAQAQVFRELTNSSTAPVSPKPAAPDVADTVKASLALTPTEVRAEFSDLFQAHRRQPRKEVHPRALRAQAADSKVAPKSLGAEMDVKKEAVEPTPREYWSLSFR